ncbi:uncharacterized protein N7529_003998 [Penicillium soppii]|uniref:uncharacterized protein n=1 Tax=Penicillium soppii TaxID=69789 RepID=UPI002548ADDF|nr:uncharacterized protein N7529_003998 [Penicillium soppii]KAJ5871645.1 hypothetical protein N7529_003998 [Penicillium soppii]
MGKRKESNRFNVLELVRSLFCFLHERTEWIESESLDESLTNSPQCDEKKPACIKCTNHSIECDFSSEAASSSDSPSSETAAHVSSTARFRFKPSKYQSEKRTSLDETAQISQEEVSATAEPNIPVLLPQSRDTISFEDLELFHHFVTETHRTLVDEATDRHRIWQTHLPKWGFSSPSIFHLILTMAALHKGHLYPEIREQYVMQADSHFTFGIRSVSAILSSLDSDNCQLIYMSAVLICLVYFAHGPRTGEYLVFSETGKAEWLVLMRGVRSILTSNREKIFTGVLEIQIDPTVQGVSPLLQTELREHQFRIEEVRRFIEMKLGEGSCGIYLGALDNLMEMFEESYQTLSAGKDGICLMSFVVGWIYRLPEEFVGLLEEKDPISLIILAYWCVLLKFMKSSWLMIGWDRHVLGGIQASLSEDLHRWIEWPVRVICG